MKSWYPKLDRAWNTLELGGSGAWKRVLDERMKTSLSVIPSGNKLMERLCIAIAYSQGAPSDLVHRLVVSGRLKESLHGFDVAAIAAETRQNLLKRCWKSPLTCIRFKDKLWAMIRCARVLQRIETEHGSFRKYLGRFRIPRRIAAAEDIPAFWQAFPRLQADLKARQMPFFSNTTSLLQLLLDLDFDSVKPDLIVMRVAKEWGIVSRETGNPAFRQAVRAFQQYGVDRQRRPLAVDWVVLTQGRQKGAFALWERKL